MAKGNPPIAVTACGMKTFFGRAGADRVGAFGTTIEISFVFPAGFADPEGIETASDGVG